MASRLQKFPSGNESRAEKENNEMGIQNYRERSRSNNLERYHVEALCCWTGKFFDSVPVKLNLKNHKKYLRRRSFNILSKLMY